jgi:hypothetical protein
MTPKQLLKKIDELRREVESYNDGLREECKYRSDCKGCPAGSSGSCDELEEIFNEIERLHHESIVADKKVMDFMREATSWPMLRKMCEGRDGCFGCRLEYLEACILFT